jgi:hypothetical protein
MRIASSVVLLLSGMLAGVVLVLSCGDDSPSRADAATCDCPAAEPPLAGRLVRVNQTVVIDPGTSGYQGAGCPTGSVLVSGSCTNSTSSGPDLTLQQSGFIRDDQQGWDCFFKNNSASPVTVKVTAICLMPAS